MTNSISVDKVTTRFVQNFKNDSLEKHLTSSHGQKILATHEDLLNKCSEFLESMEEQKKSIIQMFKKYLLKDFLNQEENKLFESIDKKAVEGFYEANKTQLTLPNVGKNNKLGKLQEKINSLYKEASNGDLHIKSETDKIEELNYRITRVQEELKVDMLEKFSFSNVDNLIKNMHLFDEKVNYQKQLLESNKNINMLSSISNIGGNLDMLFSTCQTTDNRKSELPKDLKNFVDNLSNRLPKNISIC